MKLISPVRIQMMYRKGARLFWKSSFGAMKPGLQNGYAVTAFDTEIELRTAITQFKYTELFQQYEWKVGTAETTEVRLREMFEIKRPLLTPSDIWDRFYMPLNSRLSKYQGDVKSYAAGTDRYMTSLIARFDRNGKLAILMLPLVLGYRGTANSLETEMSKMIISSGGIVVNDKKVQSDKIRAATTEALIGLEDKTPNKLLKLTPTLEKLGFELHPEIKPVSIRQKTK